VYQYQEGVDVLVRAFYQKLKGEEFKYLHLPGVTSPIGLRGRYGQ
jgi:hypothetical protein